MPIGCPTSQPLQLYHTPPKAIANERDVRTTCNGLRPPGIRCLSMPTRHGPTGRVYAAVKASGRKHRSRLADLLIASTAAANELALYTRNPSDLKALEDIIDVIAI